VVTDHGVTISATPTSRAPVRQASQLYGTNVVI